MLEIEIKSYKELTKDELYSLLQLRSQVFVLEQECIYHDVDGKDKKALHVLGYKDNILIAYTRIFKPGDYFEEAAIGRVLVVKKERAHKYGYAIMNASIDAIKTNYSTSLIKISAQLYLNKFYNTLGFKAIGEPYLEENMMHIAMLSEFK